MLFRSVAGSASVEYGGFARFAYAGACVWTLTFLLLGWYLGEEWRAIIERLHVHGMIAAAAALVVIAAFAIGILTGAVGLLVTVLLTAP